MCNPMGSNKSSREQKRERQREGEREKVMLRSTTVVTTTASEAVLASWSRIAANANKNESLQSTTTSETYGELWCVVHGRSLPADSRGWVRLQFHAGQAWVPEKKGKVIALFLLPACTFPPPHLEDNMLCPSCVHKNRVLNKSLQG
ncbi:Developmental pluripotency-associated protein 4 [Lemmus lemmus]